MTLFQFLRFIKLGTPIILYDVEGVEISKVNSKEYLSIELFEYPVLGTSVRKDYDGKCYLTIDLEK